MVHLAHAVIAGAIGAAALVVVFGYFFFLGSVFDYSKAAVVSAADQEYLTDEVIRKSIDAAISDPTTKLFLARFDNPELKAQVSYLTPSEVEQVKKIDMQDKNADLVFLPDRAAAIQILFDSDTGGAVPEHPMLGVYIQPESYKVLGTEKVFW